MKTEGIYIRMSKETKEEIRESALKLSHEIGIKVNVSIYMLWLHEQSIKEAGDEEK